MAITLETINSIFAVAYRGGAGFAHNAGNDKIVDDLNTMGITESDVFEYTETDEFKAHERGYHALRGLKKWYKVEKRGGKPVARKPRTPKPDAKPDAKPTPTPMPTPDGAAAAVHEKMAACMNVLKVAERPLLMVGPAGSGKSYLAAKIAEACGATETFTQSKVSFETDLKGFMDAYNHYSETALYRAMKRADGGEKTAFFLDEIFGGDTSCLIVINDLLSDGKMTFPNGETLSADNLLIMAADNTSGNGADNIYNNRNKADKSFLNRFGAVHVDYDKRVEKKLARGHADILEFVHAVRAAAEHVDLDIVCSYRTIDAMAKYADAGIDAAEAVETFVYQDALTTDDKDILRRDAKIERLIQKGNVYAMAM